MKNDRTSLRIPRSLWAACVLLAACGGSSHHSSLSLEEREPNDLATNADFIGGVYPGADYLIHGHVTDDDFDPYDGFAFVVDEPSELFVVLEADDPYADIDFAVYDPELDEFVLFFEDVFNPETGSFLVEGVGAEFHIVVSSFDGDTGYSLDVFAEPAYLALEAAPGPTDTGAAPAAPREARPAIRMRNSADGKSNALKPESTHSWGDYRKRPPISDTRGGSIGSPVGSFPLDPLLGPLRAAPLFLLGGRTVIGPTPLAAVASDGLGSDGDFPVTTNL